jgi:hypothetical protein
MGWSIGWDARWGRDIGYGVPATCDFPGCGAEIDRGLGYVCGREPYGGERGCGLYFCEDHQRGRSQLCPRCANRCAPYTPSPDVREWVEWKLSDPSWATWRMEHQAEVVAMQERLKCPAP